MEASVKRRPHLPNALKRLSALSGHGVTRRNGKTLFKRHGNVSNGMQGLLWKRSLRGGALRPRSAFPAERALGAGALAKASVRSARRALNRSARFSAQPERPQERPSGALRSARRSARPERPQERPSGALRSARQERPQERPSEAPAGAPRSACLERPFWSAQERSSRSVRWERSDRSALLER